MDPRLPTRAGLGVVGFGSLWVAEYGPQPHPAGSARISRRSLDGEMSDAWIGFNLAIGLAFGPDDNLYSSEMGHKSEDATGRIVRLHAADTGLTGRANP